MAELIKLSFRILKEYSGNCTFMLMYAVSLCYLLIFEKDKVKLNKNSKLILLIVVLISMLLIPTSLLSWTPEGSTVIMGLQGGYFQ